MCTSRRRMPSEIFFHFFGLLQLVTSTVFLNRAKEGVAVCRMAPTDITCTTTTADGFLSWRNSSGVGFTFGDTVSVGATGTLGSTTMTLNSVEAVSNAVVYTSTASENMMENTTIQCSDGDAPQSIDVTVKSPSSPLWAYSACSFTQGNVQLSWNGPSVAAECCAQYTVQLSTGSVYNTSETSVALPIGGEAITAIVYCVDEGGKMVTKTEDMTINSNIAIELTIKPVNSSCDASATYQISWTTDTSSQNDVCTPPITNSTITCTSSSTNQSSNNTRSMNCSVPANETVSATVTITNAAGVTASESAYADVLAQACQRLNSALMMSTCTPPKLKEAYKLNNKNLPKEKEAKV